ncbi:hypothetical protein [Kalamiella sp. sgz302252]|uniref:hypothetical protein n=1 Tax=Pantoea sp. sgz302252 TaxID=3341827 RepID=UPI0036D30A02
MNTQYCSEPTAGGILSRDLLYSSLKHYGFSEIDDLLRFLIFSCESVLGEEEQRFVHSKLKSCLSRHDNGSDYFNEMKIILEAVSRS